MVLHLDLDNTCDVEGYIKYLEVHKMFFLNKFYRINRIKKIYRIVLLVFLKIENTKTSIQKFLKIMYIIELN